MGRIVRIEGLVQHSYRTIWQAGLVQRYGRPPMLTRLQPWRVVGGPMRTLAFSLYLSPTWPDWLWRWLLRQDRAIAAVVELDERHDCIGHIMSFRGWRRASPFKSALKAWIDQRPRSDPRFGGFEFDDDLNFSARPTWQGKPVELRLFAESFVHESTPVGVAKDGYGEEALAAAHWLFDEEAEISRRIEQAITAEALPTYNERRVAYQLEPLDAETLRNQIELRQIDLMPVGPTGFYFEGHGLTPGFGLTAEWESGQVSVTWSDDEENSTYWSLNEEMDDGEGGSSE